MQGATILSLLCAVVCAAPLAYAGVAKLLDEQAFVPHLPTFGLPATPAVVRTVALGELVSATAMIVWSAPAAVVPATVAYALFALAMARAVRAGRSGDCGCFG